MRSVRDRLADVLEAIEHIQREAAAGRDGYLQDRKVQVWMIHHIQIIGEAVRAVSAQLRELDPSMPWAAIVGMRNVLVHNYFGIDPEEVWTSVERDIPLLRAAVERLLSGALPGDQQ